MGVRLADGSGVSNHYSQEKKFERGEPGEVHYYLDHESVFNPRAVAKVWLDPEQDVSEAAMIPE